MEALTLGMPFEVWKTRMGRYRNENTVSAFVNVYKAGGGGMKGVMSFWAGLGPKMVESASKGAVLLVSREGMEKDNDSFAFSHPVSEHKMTYFYFLPPSQGINRFCMNVGVSKNVSAFIAGGGGGVRSISSLSRPSIPSSLRSPP